MRQLQTIFLKGLLSVLPLAAAIYVIYSCISLMENLLGSTLRLVLPIYIPGLGFLMTLVVIMVCGALLNNLITGSILRNIERALSEVPFFKAVYSPLRDLMNLFSQSSQKGMKGVVLVDLDGHGIKVMGIITRDQFEDIKQASDLTLDKVAVYIPLSYSLGGFTLLVPKDRITKIDLTVEKAMSLAITAWVKSEPKG